MREDGGEGWIPSNFNECLKEGFREKRERGRRVEGERGKGWFWGGVGKGWWERGDVGLGNELYVYLEN